MTVMLAAMASEEKAMDLELLKETPPWEWPEGTGAGLRKLLEDDGASADDRLIAAELASDITVVDEPMTRALLALVRREDLPEALRCQAAIALGPCLEEGDTMGFDEDPCLSEVAHGRVVDELRQLYLDAGVPDDVRRRILEASVRAPQPWHADAVREAHASDRAGWRLTAVFCMEYVRGFDEQILEALRSEEPELVFHAVCAAGSQELDAAWDAITALATDAKADQELRLVAIDATVAIRPAGVRRALLELIDDDDQAVVEAAEEAMELADEIAELSDRGDWDDDDDDDEQLN